MFTIDEKWRTRRTGFGTFGVVNAIALVAFTAIDFAPDLTIDNPSALYYFGGGTLVGLIGFFAMGYLGARAARADMVRIHGEDTVAQYEKGLS